MLAYTAGTLDEATSILVATHLALCPICRNETEIAETIGGIFLEDTSNLQTSNSDIGFAPKSTPLVQETAGPPVMRTFVLPKPLRRYTGGDAQELAWKSIGGRIRQFPIETKDKSTTARLLSIPASKGVPDHGHRGFEATLVLSGSFYDRDSWYRRGDISIADPTVIHHPTAGPEEDCICLVVTNARLKFMSILPRLFQWLNGI